MIYVMSDLHGCYDQYRKMLEQIRLQDEDTLYVLGDLVDRGNRNVDLILAVASRKNIRPLMGNHDYMAALMLKVYGLKEGQEKEADSLQNKPESRDLFESWLKDGGETTWKELMELPVAERQLILRFLQSLPLFTEFQLEDRVFHLSHTVPEKAVLMDVRGLTPSDFIFSRAEYDKVYFPDKILVTGHTPTGLIDPTSSGRIWQKNNHIAVDCGAVFGGPLGCICLDTGEEFYVE